MRIIQHHPLALTLLAAPVLAVIAYMALLIVPAIVASVVTQVVRAVVGA